MICALHKHALLFGRVSHEVAQTITHHILALTEVSGDLSGMCASRSRCTVSVTPEPPLADDYLRVNQEHSSLGGDVAGTERCLEQLRCHFQGLLSSLSLIIL
ncbi:hypothetical protein SRHO_G00093120 [Serrasalmus rhombeus]